MNAIEVNQLTKKFGTFTAVDAAKGTVTLAAKGGTKDVKGKTVTVSVPSSYHGQSRDWHEAKARALLEALDSVE